MTVQIHADLKPGNMSYNFINQTLGRYGAAGMFLANCMLVSIHRLPTIRKSKDAVITLAKPADSVLTIPAGMAHFYETIPGWFDFMEIYTEAVRNSREPAHFVEIGAWYGRSTAFMAVEIINSGKQIQFDVIDTWEGSAERRKGSTSEDPNLVQHGTIYPNFLTNLRPALRAITPIKLPSLAAANLYPDQSLNFVFLDAAHDYQNVKNDILAWKSKIRTGGVFAGHDYNPDDSPGLVKAVHECFGKVEFVQPRSWRTRL